MFIGRRSEVKPTTWSSRKVTLGGGGGAGIQDVEGYLSKGPETDVPTDVATILLLLPMELSTREAPHTRKVGVRNSFSNKMEPPGRF